MNRIEFKFGRQLPLVAETSEMVEENRAEIIRLMEQKEHARYGTYLPYPVRYPVVSSRYHQARYGTRYRIVSSWWYRYHHSRKVRYDTVIPP